MFCVKYDGNLDKYFHQKENAIAEVERVLISEMTFGEEPEDFGYRSWREMAEAGGLVEDLVWWFEIKFEDEPKVNG
jgi:hypothetical protein